MIVEFKNATIGYGEKAVLENLNFTVDSNDSICLLGPNGIGKTTLFKSMLGMLPLLKGDILVEGKSVRKIPTTKMATYFAYVPQSKDYSYQFSVEEIVLMGRAMYIGKFSSPSKEDYAIAAESLEKLGVYKFKDAKYSELSGGEQQIVLIARALAQQAQFIVMDEPASNLDFANQKKLLNVIRGLGGTNVGILMSTHTPDHAFLCAQKALLVSKDKSYKFGTVNDIVQTDNLSRAYGVEIQVVSTVVNDSEIKTCSLTL